MTDDHHKIVISPAVSSDTAKPFADAIAQVDGEGLDVSVTTRDVSVAASKTLGRGWQAVGYVRKPHEGRVEGGIAARWRPKK